MKLIVAGSRTILSERRVHELIGQCASVNNITEIVSGGCRGPDQFAESWARQHGVPVKRFPYESQHGKAGGPLRNLKMAKYADALLAIWDGYSRGTQDMIRKMRALDKNTVVVQIGPSGGTKIVPRFPASSASSSPSPAAAPRPDTPGTSSPLPE